MYYTIYKVTNKINGKYYIGKHQTVLLTDSYMGSGKLLRRAIKKYGSDNFIKEVLHTFDNEADMNAKEKELVVVSEETYNLCDGGRGGFSYINRTIDHKKHNQKIADKRNYNDQKWIDKIKESGKETAQRCKNKQLSVYNPEYKHILRERFTGDKNPSKRLEVRKKLAAAWTPERRAKQSALRTKQNLRPGNQTV